jgi:hypothetical protein
MPMDVHDPRQIVGKAERAISAHLHLATQQPFGADGEH